MLASAIDCRPLSPILGAEISGIDLKGELDTSVKAQLLQAWHRHGLLLFRGQDLSVEDLDRAAGIFGHVTYSNPWGGVFGDNQAHVSNVLPDALAPAGELLFHMDYSFCDEPLRGIALYAYEIPPKGAGGDTLFANVKLAYEHLPADLQRRINPLKIVHTTHLVEPRMPRVASEHRLAFTHPVTGETVLYCSPRHFERFLGVDAAEGEALCRALEAEIARPDISYRHEWEPRDFVVWDNIKLQHARTHFDASHRRHLRRIQIAADHASPAAQ